MHIFMHLYSYRISYKISYRISYGISYKNSYQPLFKENLSVYIFLKLGRRTKRGQLRVLWYLPWTRKFAHRMSELKN